MPDSLPPETLQVTTGPLPSSRKVHIPGVLHPGLRVAMREILVGGGEAPLPVYDPSGPYTDPAHATDIRRGLPELRRGWIEGRGDVEAYVGRDPQPEDDGLKPGEARRVPQFDRAARQPLRARSGTAPTQLAYARA